MRRKTVIAVIDTNVLVSGIFWNGASRRVLAAYAARKFQWAVSDKIFAEYRRVATELKREKDLAENPQTVLQWLERKTRWTSPAPISPVSRDPDDDKFLACALASSADYIVALDKDLLCLEKPFGIEIIRPGEFLKRV